jgi:hypothetical protein
MLASAHLHDVFAVIGGSVVIFRHVEVLGWMATVVDFVVRVTVGLLLLLLVSRASTDTPVSHKKGGTAVSKRSQENAS